MVWRVEKVCAGCALLILSFSMTVWSQQLMTDNAHWGEENLSYDVIYQWGFIWKKAASARLILKPIVINDVSCYKSQMDARTLAFADRIFRVRDT